MKSKSAKSPLCIVVAGPNGSGKTTFAREFLPKDAGVIHFVNADLIASGLSPLRPELAALSGGRLFLGELDRHARVRQGGQTCSGDSCVVGRTSRITTAPWPMPGRCMIIPVLLRASLNKAHENDQDTPLNFRCRRRTRSAPLRPRGTQDRPRPRHTDLPLARRQDRRRKTLTDDTK